MICIISRLGEPNIARLYPIEPEQNLVNNIRVLCTKNRETFRYFVPEEMFQDIRNGYPIPVRALCCSEDGTFLFEIDPLQILSEQLEKHAIRVQDTGKLEIRLAVRGHSLPSPSTMQGFYTRPAVKKSTGRTGAPASGPRSVKKSLRGILAAVILLAAMLAVFLLTSDLRVKQFKKELDSEDFAAAVTTYNERIYGRRSREEKADRLVESAVDAIGRDYLSGKTQYNDACAHLGILSRLKKKELSELAQNAKKEVELYESASSAYKEGLSFLEKKEYLSAIRSFLGVPAESPVMEDAQEKIETCVDRIVRAAANIQKEEEFSELAGAIDSALELLPGNEKLLEGKETCRKKYENLVRNRAVSEADEMAAAGDYEGVFRRIGEAEEALPGDERLAAQKSLYHNAYIRLITGKVTAKVDTGDMDGALSVLGEAERVHSCDEFDALSQQLGDIQKERAVTLREYHAPKAEPVKLKGAIKTKGKNVRHTILAEESGNYRFTFSKMDKTFRVKIVILSPDGEEVGSDFDMASGSGLTCRLEKGKKYTAEVTAYAGKGSYVLTVGRPGAAADISAYDLIHDSLNYKEELKLYYFVPGVSGTYRFDIAEMTGGTKLGLTICDQLGAPICIESALVAGNGVTLEMNAGEQYEIRISQEVKLGDFTLKIGHQAQAANITGRNILAGAVEYTDQKIVYTYVAAESGLYRFTVGNMENGLRVKLFVYDSLGYKIGGDDALGSTGNVTVELEGGETYQIRLFQSSGTGPYTLTILAE